MTRIVRNILVAFGAYYLSLWTAPLFSWPFDKLNVHFTYSGSLLSAVMMGVMTSMGRAVSATVAVAIVCVSADSENLNGGLISWQCYMWRTHLYAPSTGNGMCHRQSGIISGWVLIGCFQPLPA